MPLIWEQTLTSVTGIFAFLFSLFSVWGKQSSPRSDCEGLCWNLAARRLGAQPHAGSYSAAGFPPALEVSLSRALNGSTKLITSFSAFLKEPKRRRCKRAEGAPYPGDRMGQAGKGADHTNPRLTRQQKACLGNRGSLSDLFSGGPCGPTGGAVRPGRETPAAASGAAGALRGAGESAA